MTDRRVLVVTVVHHPQDARIAFRQIPALLEAGWQVTYAAPWSGYDLDVPTADEHPGLTCVDVPRAQGRHRLRAQRAARRLLRQRGPDHDVVLLHDPELLLAARLAQRAARMFPPVVWDVHEDVPAVVGLRAWMPRPLVRPFTRLATLAERWAEDRMTLLLADERYAARFRREHVVVPNTVAVTGDVGPAAVADEDGRHRVVYLGSVTMERGAAEMVQVARRLREEAGDQIRVEVLGPAHGQAHEVLRLAADAGEIAWSGFIPNDRALARLPGALAGLSLLHDEANFRPSMPTKVVEYLANAVPVVTTPLPVAADLVTRSGGGTVVPFGDTERTVAQLLAWHADPKQAVRVGRAGHDVVRAEYDWSTLSHEFVAALEQAARHR